MLHLLTAPCARLLQGLASGLAERRARHRCQAGEGARFLPGWRVVNPQGRREAIRVGQRSWIAGELLVFPGSGRIRVGDYCYVGTGSHVWSALEVQIGDRVFLAHGVNVHDNNAHALSAAERHRHFRELAHDGRASFDEAVEAAAVHIGDDAWVGFNSVILKGVRIGRGAIVGAASVVTRDVPDYAIVAGNPATVVGEARP